MCIVIYAFIHILHFPVEGKHSLAHPANVENSVQICQLSSVFLVFLLHGYLPFSDHLRAVGVWGTLLLISYRARHDRGP